jgi:hypothetical protein
MQRLRYQWRVPPNANETNATEYAQHECRRGVFPQSTLQLPSGHFG